MEKDNQEIQWFYGGGGVASESVEKLPFWTPIKISKDMDENQKSFFTRYNDMQKKLIEHGLMETK